MRRPGVGYLDQPWPPKSTMTLGNEATPGHHTQAARHSAYTVALQELPISEGKVTGPKSALEILGVSELIGMTTASHSTLYIAVYIRAT